MRSLRCRIENRIAVECNGALMARGEGGFEMRERSALAQLLLRRSRFGCCTVVNLGRVPLVRGLGKPWLVVVGKLGDFWRKNRACR